MAAGKRNSQNNTSENGEQSSISMADNLAIGGIIQGASKIVLKAAGILDKEIARGVLAAKQVEEKLIDVPKIRSGQVTDNRTVNEMIVNARSILHDLADIVMDIGVVAIQGVGKISSGIIKISTDKSGVETPVSQNVPLIQVPQELHPGEAAEFPVMLENDNTREEKNISFISTLLSDSSGNQLSPETLTFNPNPLIIPAASKGTVHVKIAIPATAKPGSYTSFIQGQNMDSLKATLMVRVVS